MQSYSNQYRYVIDENTNQKMDSHLHAHLHNQSSAVSSVVSIRVAFAFFSQSLFTGSEYANDMQINRASRIGPLDYSISTTALISLFFQTFVLFILF